MPNLSVIVPVCQEAEILPALYARLHAVMEREGLNHEIIFVDDGSRDGTRELVAGLARSDRAVKLLSFSRNFGHQAAITAGLYYAGGEAVVVMDGDLQDPPEVIGDFLRKWREGFSVVYGIRRRRKESWFKIALYQLYYRLLSRLAEIEIPRDSGDFCLMDRKVVEVMNRLPERTRFLRGLRCWVGFDQVGVPYERGRRSAGKTKYGYFNLVHLGLDGIISFSKLPLRLSILCGSVVALFSLGYGIMILLSSLLLPARPVPGFASIVVGVTFLGGIQLLFLGLLGEYLLRIFDETKQRPLYVMQEAIGFEHGASGHGNHPRP